VENPSRRRVLTAGLAGTTLALAGWRPAHATTPPTPPERPTDADTELLAELQGLELAARDLYQAAIDAGASDEAGVLSTLRSNHEGYANRISGVIGGAAPQKADDAVFAQFVGDFETSDLDAVAAAGYEFESSAVATYLEALGELEGIDGAALAASILIVESRQCAVLADLGGDGDDLDALLVNDAAPLALGGGTTG
jgi:Ferritin-like domain